MIIGLNGCYCHPFKNWEECERFHNQKLKKGDAVINRCSGKKGFIYEAGSTRGDYIVNYEPCLVPSDRTLEDAASLVLIIERQSNFLIEERMAA